MVVLHNFISVKKSKDNKTMKMTDIVYRYYGDFDLINEKWNEDYESILIRPKDDQEYKRCRLAKKTPKKEGYFTIFWKKDQDN